MKKKTTQAEPVQIVQVSMPESRGGELISAALALAVEWRELKSRHPDGIHLSCECMADLFGATEVLYSLAEDVLSQMDVGTAAALARVEDE